MQKLDCCCDNLHNRHSIVGLHGQFPLFGFSFNCHRIGLLLGHLQGNYQYQNNTHLSSIPKLTQI